MKFLLPAAKATINVAFAVALAALCASWLWRIAGPREIARAAGGSALAAAPDLAATGKLFGTPVVVNPVVQNPLADVQLKGIYRTQEGSGGFAVVQIGNQPARPVMAGAEIRPGLKLSRLGADHAIFSGERGETRLDLPARPALIKPAPN